MLIKYIPTKLVSQQENY